MGDVAQYLGPLAPYWDGYIWPLIWIVLGIVAILAPVMFSVAYLTYAERKVIGAMQIRKGPNVVGPFGLLQPIADAVKLLFKETIIPSGANKILFVMAPMLTFVLALVAWAVIPFGDGLVLADIQLADGSSGIDAVKDILKRVDVPVIFITAFPERLLTGERPEPTFLITKPFQPETVKAAISQAMFFHPSRQAAEV